MKKLSNKVESNVKYVKSKTKQNKDLIVRDVLFAGKHFAILYLNEQSDEAKIEKFIIQPIMTSKSKIEDITFLQKTVVQIADTTPSDDLDSIVDDILRGKTAVFEDGERKALVCNTISPAQRSVEEPPTSAVIYGPREGFVENIKVNLCLIRKRLPTTHLKLEEIVVGKYTKTKITVCYLNDIADKHVVNKVVERLKSINIDGVIESHYLIAYLEERKGSIFKQIGKTEKPDIAVAKMLEGRVAILVDGSPIVLTLPFVAIEDLQNSDDYYQRSFHVAIVRFFRLFSILMSILLPGVYVAIQLYHYNVIPIKFLITIINSTEGIPFTPLLEMLFVLVLFEILFEASLRMPRYIGVALSVVGALVLGDTAVKAGLISSPAVMIIALTGISLYTIPDQTSQISILRLLFTFLGGILGLIGITIGGCMLVAFLSEFNAYGAPYLAPYAPYIPQDVKDGIFKRETISQNTIPKSIPNQKSIRERTLHSQNGRVNESAEKASLHKLSKKGFADDLNLDAKRGNQRANGVEKLSKNTPKQSKNNLNNQKS